MGLDKAVIIYREDGMRMVRSIYEYPFDFASRIPSK